MQGDQPQESMLPLGEIGAEFSDIYGQIISILVMQKLSLIKQIEQLAKQVEDLTKEVSDLNATNKGG